MKGPGTDLEFCQRGGGDWQSKKGISGRNGNTKIKLTICIKNFSEMRRKIEKI